MLLKPVDFQTASNWPQQIFQQFVNQSTQQKPKTSKFDHSFDNSGLKNAWQNLFTECLATNFQNKNL